MLVLVFMVSLTSVLFKVCLHMVTWSRTLSFLPLIYSCCKLKLFPSIKFGKLWLSGGIGNLNLAI